MDILSLDAFVPSVRKLVKRVWSIHYFLMITLISILTLVMMFLGVINYWQVYRESAHIFDTELAASASVLNTIVENNIDIQSYHDALMYQVWNIRSGELLFHSDDAPHYPITEKESGYDTYLGNDQSAWRVYILSNPRKDLRVMVALKKDVSFHFQMHVFIHDLEMLLLIYVLISVAIFLVIQKGLRALNHTVQEISKRSGENLKAINLDQVPVELRPVVQEINRLFARVDHSMAREKRFTADAAHELRTPLAALKTQVEIAKRESNDIKRIEILDKIIEGTNRCAHVVDQLLVLSRLEPEALALSKLDRVNLSEVAELSIADLIPSAIEKNIELEFSLPEKPVFILGKAPALDILVRNLVSNAIRYTPEHGQITVVLSIVHEDGSRWVCLQVIDNGPGVPEELHSRIFDRFFRQLGNTQPGSGLGLSIVTQVVHLHHGKILAKTPDAGKGLEVRVLFPQPTP